MVELEQWVLRPEPDNEGALAENILPLPEVQLPQPTSAEPVFAEPTGVPISTLLERRASMPLQSHRKARVVPDEQGLLFSGVE